MKKLFSLLFLSLFLFSCDSQKNLNKNDLFPDSDVLSSDSDFKNGGNNGGDFDQNGSDDGNNGGDSDQNGNGDGNNGDDSDQNGSDDGNNGDDSDQNGSGGGNNGDDSDQNGSGGDLRVRIVAANLTSGSGQSYDSGEGIRILQALNADLILLQEMNYDDNSSDDYKTFAQKLVGTDYYAVDDANFQIPNGVVSKWPIISSGYWDDPNISNRELMWAVVDIPGETDIFAISVHLHTKPPAHQVKAAETIVNGIAAVKANGSKEYYFVVGGDFNGNSALSSNGFGRDGAFYIYPPHPVDENGNENTNAGRARQYDFVLVDPNLRNFQVPTIFVSSTDSEKSKSYNDGLVFDTRVYTQSELDEYFPPARRGDSAASNMQHMAIVKDFLIEGF